jgi:AAHS family 4-hydroxybenzoate transporter-like MFS transporter
MDKPGQINIADVIDNARVGAFQIRMFVLCALSLIMDGFDVQVMGFVAPAITAEWNVPRDALGLVFGMGNFGMLIGALIFTTLADRIGRRPVLVGATLWFAVMTLLTARAGSVQELLILRFLTGLALGCVIPNATALIGEYSPKRLRVTLMMTITVGFTAGAAAAGFVSAWLIEDFGWRAVFYFGGVVPLVAGVLMLFSLPESLQFLVVRQRKLELVGKWLRQIDPSAPADGTRYFVSEEQKAGVPFMHLFRHGRALGTTLLWVVNFMNILVLYSVSNWLPTVVTGAGYSQTTAALVGAVQQVGGTIGTFFLAALISRVGFVSVLTTSFAVACVSIASIGPSLLSLALLFVVVFIAGWSVIGAQPGVNALAATFYPTYMRSTGIGWGLGIGRGGAIVGPILGGVFLSRQWTPEQLFLAAATPAFVSCVAMFAFRWAAKASATQPTPEPAATAALRGQGAGFPRPGKAASTSERP